MSFQDGQQPKLHAQLDRADAERAAGNDRVRESRGNGWHTDFGTKSSVLYPSRRETGEITDWPQPVRDFDRTEKEERGVSVSTPHGRTFSESRGGYSPLPRLQNTTKEV